MVYWIDAQDVMVFQRIMLEEHGGAVGGVDSAAMESTLARPRNLLSYEPGATIYDLAATYAYGFAKNHVFTDGNKRVAFMVSTVFLEANGYEFFAEEADVVYVFTGVAEGDISQDDLTQWFEANSRPPIPDNVLEIE